ncbi:E-selectin-like isoform X2 [Myxocyprinus asiaticus]|uniref:E-selectin-like isoform X2 n=1 Tax=Myxocyprinus asiaticus TaxID=70543 RepID=UPI00222288C7|nr:E-selectin-like isoform X2 [Myxocyprinus asiaticus]
MNLITLCCHMKLDVYFVHPECHKLKCKEPDDYPEVQLGDSHHSKSVFDNGQHVEYKCAPGYVQVGGSRKSHCKEGHWTPLKMKCRKIKCKPLSAIHRGRCMPEGDSYGDKAIVECDEGYVLRGNRVRVCEETGWSGSSPTCEAVKCPDIVITNGQVTSQAVEFNTVVQITCSPGFKLNGAQTIRCGADGSWIPSVPTCEPVKCPPIIVANGQVGSPAVAFNALVRITCSPGFKLNGAQTIRCGADGSWTPNVPNCEPVKCPDIAVANGQVSSPAIVYNALVQITCSPGFKLNGAQTIRCGADGSWIPSVPTCEPVSQDPQNLQYPAMSCSAPVVKNGVIKGGVKPLYEPNDAVIIVCKAGCYMVGVSEAKCGPDGQWQGLPRCLVSKLA